MITGIHSLKLFSVMIPNWETNFTDLQAKIANIKLVEGALLSLSFFISTLCFSLSLSLLVPPSLAFSLLAASPFFLWQDWSHPPVRSYDLSF